MLSGEVESQHTVARRDTLVFFFPYLTPVA